MPSVVIIPFVTTDLVAHSISIGATSQPFTAYQRLILLGCMARERRLPSLPLGEFLLHLAFPVPELVGEGITQVVRVRDTPHHDLALLERDPLGP